MATLSLVPGCADKVLIFWLFWPVALVYLDPPSRCLKYSTSVSVLLSHSESESPKTWARTLICVRGTGFKLVLVEIECHPTNILSAIGTLEKQQKQPWNIYFCLISSIIHERRKNGRQNFPLTLSSKQALSQLLWLLTAMICLLLLVAFPPLSPLLHGPGKVLLSKFILSWSGNRRRGKSFILCSHMVFSMALYCAILKGTGKTKLEKEVFFYQ